MSKLKIIQTPVRYYPSIGGVENHVMYLSEELVKLGHQVEVICANVPKTSINKRNGVVITRLKSIFNITNTNITLGLPLFLLKSNFDLIHTHMPTPWTCDWSIIIAKLKGKKSVLTIHNDMQKVGFFSKLITDIYLNTVFRISLLLVNKIIIVNPEWDISFNATKNLLLPFKNKISVIPNGVNTELFKSTKKKKPNNILFVSVLDKYHWFKGLDLLIDAIKEIITVNPRITLTIIGEGELRFRYQKLVIEKKLEKNIIFVGKKEQEELVDYFSEASIFVLPSTDTEGFGIVLLESLACETPVITTDITGVAKDIKNTKSGYIIKPKSSKELGNAIISLLGNKLKLNQMGMNGRILIEKKYSWKSISQEINNLYLLH